MKSATVEQKELTIVFHVRGYNKSRIAKQIGLSQNTVSSLINAWKKEKQPQQRRRPKLTAQRMFNVHRYFIENPLATYGQCIQRLRLPVSKSTVRNVLTKKRTSYYVDSCKTFQSLRNQFARLRFALKYQHWTGLDWLRVSFLGSRTVQQQTYFNGIISVGHGERQSSQNNVTNDQQSKVNLVVVVSHNGPNMLYSVSDNFQANHFEQLIKRKVAIGPFVLMNNNEIYSKDTKYLMMQCGSKILDFPPESRDLDIIEDIGSMLRRKINLNRQNVSTLTKDELLKLIDKCWREIPGDFIEKCILSMPGRLKEVIKN